MAKKNRNKKKNVEQKENVSNDDENPWSNLNWKKVDVSNDKKRKNMDDGNDDGNIGVCMYGLEVLSGDDYNFHNNTMSIEKKPNKEDTKNEGTKNEDTKSEDTNTKKEDTNTKNEETNKKPKKKKKNKKKNTPKPKETKESPETSLEEIEQSWSKESNYTLTLHPTLLTGLQKLNYKTPTSIQAKILSSGCIYNKTNIIAAAPTGSGKTLSFGLTILHNLLSSEKDGVKGLVLAPSRELALQITQEFDRVCNHTMKCVNVVTVVGGLSQVKQLRLLKSTSPTVVVATPGRLWELISSGENELLNGIGNTLEYLVIDEVDRMMMCSNEQIVFPELQNIFDFINQHRDDSDDNTKEPKQQFQTFILSATLAMNYKQNPNIKTKKTIQHQNKRQKVVKVTQEENVDFLSRIMDRIGIVGPIQSIDLTLKSAGCLPSSISLFELKCVQKHKDSYTYAMLSTFQGPTIIFCNSIQCVKRVTATLSILLNNKHSKATVHGLYGNMPQKARLQALESISNQNAILVSTDVAARGIDIPSISTIIHYDVAHTVDTFIHRTGRTARGVVDTQREYKSISIVAPGKEEQRHETILSSLSENEFQTIKFNSNILKEVQSRTSLASQIYLLQNEQSKQDMEENYMKKLSKEADMEFDDEDDKRPVVSKGNKKKIQRLKWELNGRLENYSLDEDRKSMFGGSFTFGIQNSLRLGLF